MNIRCRTRLCLLLGWFALVAAIAPPQTQADDFASEGFYPNDEVGYFNLDLGYRGAYLGGITQAGHGFFLEFGVNAGRFINDALILSPMLGINLVSDGAYAPGFLDDFNRYYRMPPEYEALTNRDYMTNPRTEEEDREVTALEAGAARLDYLRAGKPENTFDFYYGLILRYPHRYAPVVKVYSKFSFTNMGSSSTGWTSSQSGARRGANTLDRWGWGVETIVFRGYTVAASNMGNLNLGYVSLFYECFDLTQAVIYQKNDVQNIRAVYLREYVEKPFMDKWGKEQRVGVKVGMQFQ